jgi:hypothetical protein
MMTIDGGTGAEWLRNSPGGNANESLDFVGPNLGFELSKRGYDVWLLSFRGNPDYAYKHLKSNSDHDLEYWDFSLDELALFDLPAAVDYIRTNTGFRRVGAIALSTSNTMYFMLASKVKRFNNIVQPFIGLAPVISQKHGRNAQIPEQRRRNQMNLLKVKRGQAYFRGILRAIQQSPLICHDKISAALVCNPLLFSIVLSQFGDKYGRLNYDRLIVYATEGSAYAKSSWLIAQEMSFSLSETLTS